MKSFRIILPPAEPEENLVALRAEMKRLDDIFNCSVFLQGIMGNLMPCRGIDQTQNSDTKSLKNSICNDISGNQTHFELGSPVHIRKRTVCISLAS